MKIREFVVIGLSLVASNALASEKISHPSCQLVIKGESVWMVQYLSPVLESKGYAVVQNGSLNADHLELNMNDTRYNREDIIGYDGQVEDQKFQHTLNRVSSSGLRTLSFSEDHFDCLQIKGDDNYEGRCWGNFLRINKLLVTALPDCVVGIR